jgi:hypothetical protein
MGTLSGVGSFGVGLLRGAEFGLELQNKMDKRKEAKKKKSDEDEIAKAGREVLKSFDQKKPAAQPQPQPQPAAQSQMADVGLEGVSGINYLDQATTQVDDTAIKVGEGYKNGGVVKKYADGGVVNNTPVINKTINIAPPTSKYSATRPTTGIFSTMSAKVLGNKVLDPVQQVSSEQPVGYRSLNNPMSTLTFNQNGRAPTDVGAIRYSENPLFNKNNFGLTRNYGLGGFAGNNVGGINPTTAQTLAARNKVRGFADGGLVAEENAFSNEVKRLGGGSMVQDAASLVGQVNQNTPQPTAQPETGLPTEEQPQEKVNYGKRLSASFNAMRDKALELGRADLAKDYQDAGFQIRDRMFKENLQGAQRAFQMTGDIGGFVQTYNDAIDDDANIDGYEQTPEGTYRLKLNVKGNIVDKEFTQEQIQQMVMEFSDPSARYAAERQAQAERSKKTFDTDEDIRKSQATESGKVHSVGAGTKLVTSEGVEIANNPKVTTGLDSIKSVSGGYVKENADGSIEYVPTKTVKGKGGSGGGDGDDDDGVGSNESGLKPNERLAALKNLSEITEKRFGTVSDETGKVSPNAKSIQVATRSERLFDANPNIPPETLVQIAADGESGWQVMQRPDGTQYEVPVVKYQDQIYKIGQGGKRPVKEAPAKKSEPKKQAAATETKPSDSNFNVVSEASAAENPTAKAGLEGIIQPQKDRPAYEKQYQKADLSLLEKELKRHKGQKGQYAVPERVEYLEKLIAARKAEKSTKSLYGGN